jgi:hypothetical protein
MINICCFVDLNIKCFHSENDLLHYNAITNRHS